MTLRRECWTERLKNGDFELFVKKSVTKTDIKCKVYKVYDIRETNGKHRVVLIATNVGYFQKYMESLFKITKASWCHAILFKIASACCVALFEMKKEKLHSVTRETKGQGVLVRRTWHGSVVKVVNTRSSFLVQYSSVDEGTTGANSKTHSDSRPKKLLGQRKNDAVDGDISYLSILILFFECE